jgi:exonuclease III
VAVIVRDAWEIRKVVRHGSGRAIAVVVGRGAFEMVVVSVYMPSSLDTASDDTALGSELRAMAADVYSFVRANTSEHTMFLVAGDFNETRCGRLDRVIAHRDGTTSVGAANPRTGWSNECMIEDFAGRPDSACVDLARHLHPEACMYTFRRLGGDPQLSDYLRPMSRSRIDYFLVPRRLVDRADFTWTCEVGEYLRDHAALHLSLVAPAAFLPSAPLTGTVFRPDHPSVEGLSEKERGHLAAECDKMAASLLRKWQGKGQRRITRRKGWLNKIAQTLLTRIKRLTLRRARRGDRGAGNGTPEGTALDPLARLRALNAACGGVKEALREITRGERDAMNTVYKQKVGQLQALLGFCPGSASETCGRRWWRR